METKTTQTFDLSDGDVKEAVAMWIEKKYGIGKPMTVHIQSNSRLEGYGGGEYEVYYTSVSATREV